VEAWVHSQESTHLVLVVSWYACEGYVYIYGWFLGYECLDSAHPKPSSRFHLILLPIIGWSPGYTARNLRTPRATCELVKYTPVYIYMYVCVGGFHDTKAGILRPPNLWIGARLIDSV
jgi:hypothetical protein